MIGVVLSCYERPEFLKTTLDGLKKTPMQNCVLYIIDDCSTSLDTQELIEKYFGSSYIIKTRNLERKGISHNLLMGFNFLKSYGCDIFVNIDSDVELKPEWLFETIRLLNKFPDHIITGFNANNTTRLPIIAEHDNYYEKKYIGGINICFKLCNFANVIESLQPDDIWQKGNAWDWHLCDIMSKQGKNFLVTKPGVIQHIGDISTLGHKGGDKDLNF